MAFDGGFSPDEQAERTTLPDPDPGLRRGDLRHGAGGRPRPFGARRHRARLARAAGGARPADPGIAQLRGSRRAGFRGRGLGGVDPHRDFQAGCVGIVPEFRETDIEFMHDRETVQEEYEEGHKGYGMNPGFHTVWVTHCKDAILLLTLAALIDKCNETNFTYFGDDCSFPGRIRTGKK